MSVLVWAEHDGLRLDPATARAVTAARKIDPSVHVLVAGAACGPLAVAASALAGVEMVLSAEAPHYAHALAEPAAALLAALAGPYAVVLAPATAHAKAILPRLAALIDRPYLSEVSAVVDADTFERPIYAGSLIETVRCVVPKVVTVRTVSFAPALAQDPVPVTVVAGGVGPGPSQFVTETAVETGRPDLGSARVVVSGGRGVGSAEGFKSVEALADMLQAAVGASRAAVDLGFVPNDSQVGQSGRTVAPDLYLAVGISGAIQHVAGIRDAKIVAAINKDPEAPIFRMADFGLVADLFSAVPALQAELKKRG